VTAAKEDKDDKNKKKTSPTHRLINLLGMIGSRNFILALRMHRAVTGKFPVLETKDKKGFLASEYLRTALDIEELFSRNKFPYSESVYAAGVHFDWLRFIASQREDFKKTEPYFIETNKRARRYAALAHCLAERAPQFGFHKLAAPAAMLTQVGKLHMALAYPNWQEFEEEMAKIQVPPVARLLKERETFGISQEEPAAFGLQFFSVFQYIEPSIRFYREPYFLKEVDPLLYRLAIFLELVDSLGREWKLPADANDPLIVNAKRPWHKDLPIPSSEWIDAIRVAMNTR
jgi:hypothetical protein